MTKVQSKRGLLKVVLVLFIAAVMLLNAPKALFAAQQDGLQPQIVEIESFSGAPLIWRHWVATPNQVIVPMGQNYVDIALRMDWAEAPPRPNHSDVAALVFPYQAFSFVPGSALLEPGIPGVIHGPILTNLLPGSPLLPPGFVLGFPNGESQLRFEMRFVNGWDLPGWTGERAFSFRLMINSGHLQNPGDFIPVRLALPESGPGIVPVRTYKTIIRGPLNAPCQDTNLARDYLGAVMTASSEGPNRRAEFTNNGVHNSIADSWIAQGVAEEWLMVDFGKVNNFNTVRIYQAGTRIRDYRFEHSIDGVNWTVFHAGDHMLVQSPNHYEVRVGNAIQARFIRLVSSKSNHSITPIAIHEFEVYYLP